MLIEHLLELSLIILQEVFDSPYFKIKHVDNDFSNKFRTKFKNRQNHIFIFLNLYIDWVQILCNLSVVCFSSKTNKIISNLQRTKFNDI